MHQQMRAGATKALAGKTKSLHFSYTIGMFHHLWEENFIIGLPAFHIAENLHQDFIGQV
jgi:hypothetical protein